MESPKPDLNPEAALAQLADVLRELCDSLVEIALELRDFQFENDAVERQKAASQADQLVERARASDSPARDGSA